MVRGAEADAAQLVRLLVLSMRRTLTIGIFPPLARQRPKSAPASETATDIIMPPIRELLLVAEISI
jgi:hypothetical protein